MLSKEKIWIEQEDIYFCFMSFLTISKSLCSELLMKKGIERGVYKDEYGLVSDQSEAYDQEWGQDRV